jgi:hypothetical protein
MTDKRNFEDLSPEAQRLVVDLAIGLVLPPRFAVDGFGPYPIKDEGRVWVDDPKDAEQYDELGY